MACHKPGCGFPIARIVGWAFLPWPPARSRTWPIGPYKGKQQERAHCFRTLLDLISPGKILLADRYYATFWLLAASEMRNIDWFARVHTLRKVDFRRGLKLGYFD